MFREPNEALTNLHDLAVRMRIVLNEPQVDAPRLVHMLNITAQFLEQFAWLDEYLSTHGTLPDDWRSSCHRPYRLRREHVDGEIRAHQALRP